MRSCRTIRAVVSHHHPLGAQADHHAGDHQIHVLAAAAGPTEHRRGRVGEVGRQHLPSELWGVLVPGQIVGGEAGGEPPRLVIADRSQGGDILADQCPSRLCFPGREVRGRRRWGSGGAAVGPTAPEGSAAVGGSWSPAAGDATGAVGRP